MESGWQGSAQSFKQEVWKMWGDYLEEYRQKQKEEAEKRQKEETEKKQKEEAKKRQKEEIERKQKEEKEIKRKRKFEKKIKEQIEREEINRKLGEEEAERRLREELEKGITKCKSDRDHIWGRNSDYPLSSMFNRKCKRCDAEYFSGTTSDRWKSVEKMILDTIDTGLPKADENIISWLLCLNNYELPQIMKGELSTKLISLTFSSKDLYPNLIFMGHYCRRFKKEDVDLDLFRKDLLKQNC